MRLHFLLQRMLKLILMLTLVLIGSCGGGGSEPIGGGPAPPPADAIQVTVQPSQTFQTWEAWRGTLSGPGFKDGSGTERDLLPSVISAALDDLGNDLGINGVRIILHHNQQIELTNDNADPFSINWAGFDFARSYRPDVAAPLVFPVERIKQMVLPLRQRILNRGEPFSIYISVAYPKTGTSGVPVFWLNDPQEYAEMAQAFVLWMQQKSPSPPGFTAITPDYWVIANEPSNHSFTVNDIASLIPAVGSRFANNGISTKIQTGETSTPSSGYLNGVLGSANVGQYVGLVSFHGYDYFSLMPTSFTPRNDMRTAAKNLSVAQGRTIHTGMTEICCHSGWNNGSYDIGLAWARDIYWNMTEADVSIWEPFGLLNPCASPGCVGMGQDALMLDSDLSRPIRIPTYYALRQYSRAIRPGFRRVGTSCAGCSNDATVGQTVKPVAFQSAAGKFVVVVINDQSGSQAISLLGLPGGTYDITGVDPSNARSTVTYPAQSIGAGQAITVTFPAQAILTFSQR